jgi:hypothetical protein
MQGRVGLPPVPVKETTMPDITAAAATKITDFAKTRLSQTVGSGECYDLADQALSGAGAKSAPAYGKITPNANYVWGKAVTLAQLQPGDVIQFSNYQADTTVQTDVANKDGSSSNDTKVATVSRPHHTAVVKSVGANGVVTVYEQNVDGDRTVRESTLNVSGSTNTTNSSSGDSTTKVTTTIKVSGTLKFYRPQT